MKKQLHKHIINIIIYLIIIISTLTVVYWTILILTNHSPTIDALLSVFSSILLGLLFYHNEQIATLRSDVRHVKEDGKELKKDLKEMNQRLLRIEKAVVH